MLKEWGWKIFKNSDKGENFSHYRDKRRETIFITMSLSS